VLKNVDGVTTIGFDAGELRAEIVAVLNLEKSKARRLVAYSIDPAR